MDLSLLRVVQIIIAIRITAAHKATGLNIARYAIIEQLKIFANAYAGNMKIVDFFIFPVIMNELYGFTDRQ